MAFVLKSPAFSYGEEIPTRYTSEGQNLSPPLEWTGAPPETRSFALVMEDPDPPSGVTLHHWGIYNLAADRNFLPEGVGHGAKTEPLGHCLNDFGHARYDGPMPEGDDAHRYHFRLAALNVETLRVPKEPVRDLWDFIRPHVIAEAELIGSYTSRQDAS